MKIKGFTLIEFMTAIAIIGILATIIIPTVQTVRYTNIKTQVEKGNLVSPEEWEYYNKRKPKPSNDSRQSIPPQYRQVEDSKVVEKRVIRIDGKLYEVIPLE